MKLLNTTAPDAFAPVFSLGWSVLADNLRIPTVHQAQLAPAPGAGAWPIVVFSHGMGCNRFAYSKVHLCCLSAFPFLPSWRLFPGKYFRLQIPIFLQQAQLAPAPGAGAWPIVVFSYGMSCNRFAYSKVHLCCACAVLSFFCVI